MVTQQERTRLMQSFQREPAYARAVTLKFGACLLILTGLAVIGAGPDPVGSDMRGQQADGETTHERQVVVDASVRAPTPSAKAVLQESSSDKPMVTRPSHRP
jgi:hypothetical protein